MAISSQKIQKIQLSQKQILKKSILAKMNPFKVNCCFRMPNKSPAKPVQVSVFPPQA